MTRAYVCMNTAEYHPPPSPRVKPVSCGLNTRPNNVGSTSNLSALIMISGINCTNPDWLFYSGTVAITDGGRTCQLWTEHTPHQHWFDQ